FACQLDASAFALCVSPQSYSGLADGSHTFQVRATDAAGNTDPTPASYTWTVDTTAPDTTITAAPPARSNSSSASFSFTSTKRSEEHTSELQSLRHLVCRLLLEKKKKEDNNAQHIARDRGERHLDARALRERIRT